MRNKKPLSVNRNSTKDTGRCFQEKKNTGIVALPWRSSMTRGALSQWARAAYQAGKVEKTIPLALKLYDAKDKSGGCWRDRKRARRGGWV